MDLETKEPVSCRFDALVGQTHSVKVHAMNAVRLGPTGPALLVHVMMVGGVTTSDASGADALRHAPEQRG